MKKAVERWELWSCVQKCDRIDIMMKMVEQKANKRYKGGTGKKNHTPLSTYNIHDTINDDGNNKNEVKKKKKKMIEREQCRIAGHLFFWKQITIVKPKTMKKIEANEAWKHNVSKW